MFLSYLLRDNLVHCRQRLDPGTEISAAGAKSTQYAFPCFCQFLSFYGSCGYALYIRNVRGGWVTWVRSVHQATVTYPRHGYTVIPVRLLIVRIYGIILPRKYNRDNTVIF